MTLMPSASQAQFLFTIVDTDFVFRVLSFEAVESISAPFQVNVMLNTKSLIAFDEVTGKEAVLTILSHDLSADGGRRYFHGIISKFKFIGDNGDFLVYRARLVPALWKLSLEQDCRIFQDSSLESIITTILKESGMTSDRFKILFKDKNLRSRYCVQYNETDLNFISRLLEEEGAFYFFEHYRDRHVVVFCDFAFFCVNVPGNPVIAYNGSDETAISAEHVSAFNVSQRLTSTAFRTGSFNYKRSGKELSAEDHRESDPKAEIFEYAGTFGSDERGKKLAKTRLEEHRSLAIKAKGESNCPRLISGFTFTLQEAAMDGSDGNYLLLAVEHVGDQPQSMDALGGGSTDYWNGFICMPADVPLRPSRITPKPIIPGMQSAVVTGPPGEEIHQDSFGRVKVRFHWDRHGKGDEKSSCWLRCAQAWGGAGWGMQFLPRVGEEVLIAFLDGDPDRPVIVGSLFNSANMPLYNPEVGKTFSSIKTRSYPNGGRDNYHELRFDDKKGSEEIYLQSEKDWNIFVKSNKKERIGHDDILTVGNDRTETIANDKSESVGKNKNVDVGLNHAETIGGEMTLTVSGNKKEQVELNSSETVGMEKAVTTGGRYHLSIGGALNESVAGAKNEEVGAAKAVAVAGDLTESVGGGRTMTAGQAHRILARSITIQAEESITLKAGAASITLKSSGDISLKGTRISQN